MKNIKKKLSLFLIFSFVFGLFPVIGYAAPVPESTIQPDLFIYSQPCPDDISTFAINNFYPLLSSSISNGTLPISSDSITSFSLGSPFTITEQSTQTEVYYFPVFSEKTLIGTFRIFLDGDHYAGILSQYLSDELNSLINKTSIDSPAHLYFDCDNLMVAYGEKHELLLSSPFGDSPSGININSDDLIVTSLSKELKNVESISLLSPADDSPPPIKLNIIETQGANSWCYAYCASIIIRYVKGYDDNPNAEGFMKLALGRTPSTSDSLDATQVVNTAVMYYDLYPSYSANTEISQSISDLWHDVPVFLRCSDSGGGHHAIVLRGYDSASGTYSIWNPWHDFYETMTYTLTYTTGSRKFTWVGTINGWYNGRYVQ